MNLKAFAELAGVSTSTVSRALSGSGRLSAETRGRIATLAREVGFQPNQIARKLRTRRTRTVGVIVPMGHEDLQHLSDPFFSAMTGFLADALADKGYDLLLSRVVPRDGRWLDAYVGSGRIDGAIVIGQSDQAAVIDRVARTYRPLVAWGGRMAGHRHCAVGSDNRAGGAMAIRHLIERGCRRIAFVGPSDSPEFGERLAGAAGAVAEAGLGEIRHLPSRYEPEAAYRDILQALGTMNVLPDGIFAGSDVTAIGVLRALAEMGIAVPDRVRLIGYDGLPLGALVAPPLTTIDQDLRRGARLLVESLLARIDGAQPDAQLIEPRLIVRRST